MSQWKCAICGYVYDEAREGTPFQALPEGWTCPLCGADKAAFSPVGQQPTPAPAAPVAPLSAQPHQDSLVKLPAGVLAAVLSNLARGSEKQYQDRGAVLFRELADYFTSATPPVADAGLEALLDLLRADLQQGYPALNAAAQAAGDRGTQRICVWGEKVTRMLESLLARYLREGEAFLENTQVWVCSVCGFVYVGQEPPALCPVCKVPAWKFEAVEGRL